MPRPALPTGAPLDDRHKRDALISEHLWLVKQIAHSMGRRLPRHIPEDELVSAGNIGLIEAASNYDPSRPVKFETFAKHRIRGAMVDWMRDTDILSRDMRRLANHLSHVRRDLENRLQRAPEDSELALGMEMTVDELHSARFKLRGKERILEFDELPGGAQGFWDRTPDAEALTPHQSRERTVTVERLTSAICALPQSQARAVSLYYGDGLRMHEVGDVMGVSESRVCQLISTAVEGLRSMLDPEEMANA